MKGCSPKKNGCSRSLRFTLLDNVKATAEQCGIEVALYENFDDFIQQDMDAVVLANYANEHAPFAVRCLDAGKHVMSEVLPCSCPAEAVALIEAVERSGKVYAYAENYCYMKAPFEMRLRYAQGEIGEVMYCEGEYIHDCSSIWPNITYGERNHWRNRGAPTFSKRFSAGRTASGALMYTPPWTWVYADFWHTVPF